MVFAPLDMMSGNWVLKGHIFGEKWFCITWCQLDYASNLLVTSSLPFKTDTKLS